MRNAPADGLSLRHAAGLPAVILALSVCSEPDDEPTPVAGAEPGPVAVHEQPPGDPEAGYDVLVNGGYVTCGIPYSAWRRLNQGTEQAPTVPGRYGRAAQLPYSLSLYTNERGVELVTSNCLFCHGTVFDGEVVVGLGNESLDFTRDPRQAVDRIGTYVSGDAEIAAWRKWGDRISAIAPYMMTNTTGVNPAPNLTFALIAHRDAETLQWSDTPLIEPPPEYALPVSVPPWWRMAKKNAMFYNAMGRGDHTRYMMMKSLLCADGIEDADAIAGMFADVRAYIASIEPPGYPFPIDAELAANGKGAFERQCASCHGTYGEDSQYPNLLVDLETVGTDPAYALQASESSDRFMRWFNESWFGQRATALPAPGYIAPPLDGIWATAPFLHNGSVPSLATLLNSGERPTFWTRDFESPEYDAEDVGWEYRALDRGKTGIPDEERRKRVYDTTLPGYSNRGHTFGDSLGDAERTALIEYLKTL